MENYLDVFVPGRLCLFGEHSDWAGQYRRINSDIEKGSCIVVGLEQGIHAKVKKSDNLEISVTLPNGETKELACEMELVKLEKIAAEGGFFSYMAGVAAHLLLHNNIGGLSINCYKMTLPLKRGLSSSAAVCVLTARAFNITYNLNLSIRGEMEAAYRGEILTPSRCGRMDQVCAFGKKLVNVIFDGDNLAVEPLTVKNDLFLVFADLNEKKDTKAILRDLNSCYPFHRSETEERLHTALGRKNLEIVDSVKEALSAGDNEKIGLLMTRAQNVFDNDVAFISSHLKAPKLHKILEDEVVKELTFGGKGVGSQGDGSVQFVAKDQQSQEKLTKYLDSIGLNAYSISIMKQKTIKRAVIPVAGYGTRMYPISKIISKALLPVWDTDGLVKPALLVLIEQLEAVGIEKIGIIVRAEELSLYQSLFERLPEKHFAAIPNNMKEHEIKIQKLKDKIEFILQTEQLGFGHAVYQSRSFSEREPVLLLLGDYLYKPDGNNKCMQQIINEYEKYEQLIVGISEVGDREIESCGIVYGSWNDETKTNMAVEQIKEKPTTNYAKEYLSVLNRQNKQSYYAFFGQYILTPDVYEELSSMINNEEYERGEIQLTEALDRVRKQKGMRAVVVNEKRFDIGNPDEYKWTINTF